MATINNGLLDGTRRVMPEVRGLGINGGIAGAPLGMRLRGASLSGPPSVGSWKAGDQITDRTGIIWTCTAAGTPGTWAQTMPQSQTFPLANDAYQTIQEWTVTGQTDSPLPSFGMVAGSATFPWEGGGESTQGPAFWFGYNPDHLSAKQATSAHGAIGISCFADAGDTWNPATGGHGLEFNVVFTSGDGTKSIAFIETVAVDDSTGMGTLALRCGSGQFEVYEGAFEYVSEITASDIAGNSYWSCGPFANGGTAPGMNINQPVAFTNAPTFYVLSAAAQTVLFEAASGTLSFYMTAAAGAVEALWTGTTTASVQATGVSSSFFVAEATTGLAYLWLNGNPSSGNVNEILFSKNAVQDWCVQDTGPVLQIVNASSVAEFALCGGYAYFPVAAGAPSGTPTAITGLAPVRIDSTNNKIWTYINGSWKGVVVS